MLRLDLLLECPRYKKIVSIKEICNFCKYFEQVWTYTLHCLYDEPSKVYEKERRHEEFIKKYK